MNVKNLIINSAVNLKNQFNDLNQVIEWVEHQNNKVNVDHINNDKQNNNINNLRWSTIQENIRNTGISKRNTSGIKGVSFNKNINKWESYISIDYIKICLGYFDNIIPCGIKGKAVTTLNNELGVKNVDEEEVKGKILKHFSRLFEAEFQTHNK